MAIWFIHHFILNRDHGHRGWTPGRQVLTDTLNELFLLLPWSRLLVLTVVEHLSFFTKHVPNLI